MKFSKGIEPTMDAGKLPLCDEKCTSFDGKRCELMGFRHDRICEPAAVEIAEQLEIFREYFFARWQCDLGDEEDLLDDEERAEQIEMEQRAMEAHAACYDIVTAEKS